jgi:hypothetical protein
MQLDVSIWVRRGSRFYCWLNPSLNMITLLLVIAAVYFVGLLALAGAVFRAPEGFEDDNGFHTGRGPLRDDGAL